MSRFIKTLIIFCFFAFVCNASAQILDDEPTDGGTNNLIFDETEQDEELFNEIFSDHPETERDITNIKNFNDAMDTSAKLLRENGATEDLPQKKEPVEPLDGNILIGITKGSFSISKNLLQDTSCQFSVTLKSNLNKTIKVMGLNLIYKDRTFAFVFRRVPANGSQERFIRTTGNICYSLTGNAPDIDINKCKIYGSKGSECAMRLEWAEDITAPDSQARKYFFAK